ncbi:MAG: tetraprenyl-beta-curcumene synthase [Deltaproteobacteria bacterium RBG_19FT_COMBO_43_11]|nr:MAG: tetraprenyl-beta-curcumene synthase [Deltaproteobacteria bacterium RBG_19FT_COMBO_43_11]
MPVPTNLITLTTRIFLQVRPVTHHYLLEWRNRADAIPDSELRRQAQMSIDTKTFHCEGGSIYGLFAENNYQEAIKFIVAYQTISDYLDNLCDRSTSLNPDDFRALHEAMIHALTPDARPSCYYRFRKEQEDGGYLAALVQTCQQILRRLPNYHIAADAIRELAGYYCDLQVYKHVCDAERLPRLQKWFEQHKGSLPEMSWYELAACTGSTLGIFCIIVHLFNRDTSTELISKIKEAYFPWVQGLHILLDYLIDQEEDRAGHDLNFCFYYPDPVVLAKRLIHFYQQAQQSVSGLPYPEFHRLINRGLLSLYLSDYKVSQQKEVRRISRKLLSIGGIKTLFFYLHCWIYRRLQ